jgi:hypothetical protein
MLLKKGSSVNSTARHPYKGVNKLVFFCPSQWVGEVLASQFRGRPAYAEAASGRQAKVAPTPPMFAGLLIFSPPLKNYDSTAIPFPF